MQSKFNQIAEQLLQRIEAGEYLDRLPSEQDLARDFGTTNNTVRKALDLLQQRGVIVKVPYVGTFVHRKERKAIRIFWLDLTFPPEVNEQIKQRVRDRFPGYDIVFSAEQSIDPVHWQKVDYDLIRIVGVSKIPYGDCAAPLPSELLERYRNREYFSALFDVHRVDNFFYALPILFSPALLRVNRELLKDFPGGAFGPYELTWDRMLRIADWAEDKGYCFWPADTAFTLLHCLVYSGRNRPDRLHDVDFDEIRRLAKKIEPLFRPGLLRSGNPDLSDTVFWWSCRQNRVPHPEDRRFDLTAFPVDEEGVPLRTVTTGEFLLLSSQSPSPAEALEVAEYFLSPEIQGVIGEHKIGLPVFKPAALDSLDSSGCRDDLFLNETRHLLTNSGTDQAFLLKQRAFIARLADRTFDMDAFLEFLKGEIAAEKEKENFRREMLKNMFHPQTEFAVAP